MITKGIILAGGSGTRLSPVTKIINKHLLPIHDKPMIYYPLSILMLAGIRNIQIIINPREEKAFSDVLGNPKDLGISINYIIQKKPNGIGEVFKISKKFINNQKFCLILGDNFFYGQALSSYLSKIQQHETGTLAFCYPVNNIQNFGILEEIKKKYRIVEKPKKSISNSAVTGLYVFDKSCLSNVRNYKKSFRGEYEITDILNSYAKKKLLKIIFLGRGASWFDMGTFSDFSNVNQLVSIIENRQKFKIACLEEIAFNNNWIGKKNIINRIKFYGKVDLSEYLKSII
jgi:glucose-1-phosphate thymidylyltransferase